MDRFREMEIFTAVADANSFARAAERLHVSPPAVTRAVTALEGRLGARLFNRTTRRLSLTEVGMQFLENTRRLLTELECAEKEVVGEMAAPQGSLALTASVTFGRTALAPVIGDFLKAFPAITLSVTLLDRVVDLVEEGLDIGIRIGELPDSSLIARRVGEVRRILVAQPDYLARSEQLTTPQDLKRHAIIAFTGLMANREWRYAQAGQTKYVKLSPRLEVNDAATAIAGALAGEGITVALSYMVAEDIKAGRLVPVLEAYAPPPVPVQIIYPQSRLVAPKVRAFVDFASPRLKAVLEDL